MRLYELVPSTFDKAVAYRVDATHRYALPGVICDVCKATWAQTGIAYPQVELPDEIDPTRYQRDDPVPIAQFEELITPIRAVFPNDALLTPGTEFGPLEGTIHGDDYGDFAWLNPWTLLVRGDALKLLTDSVPGIVAVPTQLRAPQGRADLLELFFKPSGEHRSEDGVYDADPCPRCGRRSFRRPEQLVLNADVAPGAGPLIRLRTLPTTLLAREEVVAFIQEQELTGVDAQQIPVEP